jgi:hypothetical protein
MTSSTTSTRLASCCIHTYIHIHQCVRTHERNR